MSVSLVTLAQWMAAPEDQHLEFKEAKQTFSSESLVKYCAALANEGGGKLILGVTNNRPRRVVGSHAFLDLPDTVSWLFQQLRIRIEASALRHPDGRVVIFDVPPRPVGVPIHYKGTYLMRAGAALVSMSPDMLKRIFDETITDFSAEVCGDATLADLDTEAIKEFRDMWHRKSGNNGLLTRDDRQLLEDAEVIIDGEVTYAALILFGTKRALSRYLPQAEVIFEYRASEASGPAAQRRDYREGFFLYQNDLWRLINARNEIQHFQQGFFVFDIPTFNETVVREAILNAVSHRNYQLGNSTYVRQIGSRLEVVSPGGLPPGITLENILDRQSPRNRRLAEVFSKCGLVERSGQGVNRMFEESIKESKPRPDFTGTDDYQVALTLDGEVQDPVFVRFLEQIGRDQLTWYTTQDFLVLDLLRNDQKVPSNLRDRLHKLTEQGVTERVSRGRGTRYILSQRLYDYMGKKGVYTAKRGLDRATNKELLLKHIRDNRKEGSPLRDLRQVLPQLSDGQVQALVRELKEDGVIHYVGRTRSARWYPGPDVIGDE
jgi:ATP-dependent DNA helicase RecG